MIPINTARTPVIIGVGQSVLRDLPTSAADLPSVESMAASACDAALADTTASDVARQIDTIAFVRLVSDCFTPSPPIFGRCDNPPWALARRIGSQPKRAIYTEIGGQAPQNLVHEASNRIAAGTSELVLLSGAEVTGAMKHALRNGWEIPEAEKVDGQVDDRDRGIELISAYEAANGLTLPPDVYGIFENAWRHEQGRDRTSHNQYMAEMLASFSKVATCNPYAQFPVERDVEFLATPSGDNYHVADPYLKWSIAQDAVNQGAAVIIASVAKARELGIPEEKWVYPLSGADATDKLVIHRPSLSQSSAMTAAINQCLATVDKTTDSIQHMDLYSCFPCAVQFACDALGFDPMTQQLTQTGGLAFFGGAGNNYTMHAITSLVETLREDPGSLGLIVANGGYLSKASAGLYSTAPEGGWLPADNKILQMQLEAIPDVEIADATEPGKIESYGLLYHKNQPTMGYVLCRTTRGKRFAARTEAQDFSTLQTLLNDDPIGEQVRPRVTDTCNLFALS